MKCTVIIILSLVAILAGWLLWQPAGTQPAATQPAANPVSEPSATESDSPPAKAERYAVSLDDPSPHVQSVAEAYQTGEHPERLSPLVAPAPFDETAFRKDPQAYLNVIEPGRVYQVRKPGKGVPVLMAHEAELFHCVPMGEVRLAVQALSHAPVTFLTSNGGIFRESKLNSVTVQADAEGVASATFYANPGATHDCPVIVGSPMCAANVTLIVRVEQSTVMVWGN